MNGFFVRKTGLLIILCFLLSSCDVAEYKRYVVYATDGFDVSLPSSWVVLGSTSENNDFVETMVETHLDAVLYIDFYKKIDGVEVPSQSEVVERFLEMAISIDEERESMQIEKSVRSAGGSEALRWDIFFEKPNPYRFVIEHHRYDGPMSTVDLTLFSNKADHQKLMGDIERIYSSIQLD